ncbi:MAG TPA: hypothetical protein VKM55_05510 [Candidatus Lokiarchaeia archaeon]|nr:hypothetical protein [Candidatus Lokiarchaeia archaeon]
MSEGNNDKEPAKTLSGFGFIDQIIDGARKLGESIQVQGLLDDAFYMSSKYAIQFLLNSAAKFKIEGKADIMTNRGVIFTSIVSTPVDILLMSQVCPKKMAFIVNKEQMETPVLKSVLKAFGVIADIDEMISGEQDSEVYQWIRADRKILSIAVDETTDPEKFTKAYEKVLTYGRDGFCPITPVGIIGSKDIKPGAEIIIKIGELFGVNQNVKDEDIGAMAKDLVEKLKSLKS